MELLLHESAAPAPGDLPLEIVERKGLGHPDTLCDALAEELSRALCRFYLDRFGLILHHNVDKVLLLGGESRPAFGGGEVLRPMELFLGGRATLEHGGIRVPVQELAEECCRSWLRRHLHALDPATVRIHCLVRPGSPDLVELYLRQRDRGVYLSNDTSCGAGSAPRTALERAVLAADRALTPEDRKAAPERGEDVKIMGVRSGDRIDLTVACAFVDRHVSDTAGYLRAKERAAEEARRAVAREQVSVEVNTADDPSSGSVYLTVTGTSAESGDDGQTGRGNRPGGLITPCRPMTLEAAAGKNPVTHVGKLYNVVAGEIAAALVEDIDAVTAADVLLVSQIGRPIQDPQVADVRCSLESGSIDALRHRVREVVHRHLAGIDQLWKRSVKGELALF